jgi:hypothetical protein
MGFSMYSRRLISFSAFQFRTSRGGVWVKVSERVKEVTAGNGFGISGARRLCVQARPVRFLLGRERLLRLYHRGMNDVQNERTAVNC